MLKQNGINRRSCSLSSVYPENECTFIAFVLFWIFSSNLDALELASDVAFSSLTVCKTDPYPDMIRQGWMGSFCSLICGGKQGVHLSGERHTTGSKQATSGPGNMTAGDRGRSRTV